jgi:four helix bundle protein
MAFVVAQLSIELVEALRPLVPRIRRCDRSLADQLVRAASSVALNIAEGERSRRALPLSDFRPCDQEIALSLQSPSVVG